jgi:YHS domain-containing protein
MAWDPVCGMPVDEVTPGVQLALEERTYWFCSEACLAEFRRHPEDYTGPSANDEPSGRDV